ncbi:MAG: excinuclease ABC subunit UvrC, partial [Armatimonadetes bacterium]|nr:excinuclease ABC subunit UvrC [Armatimonadota bacterium]
LCLTVTEPFPRLIFVRRARQDGNRYYGPFPSSKAVHATQDVVKRLFPLVACGKKFDGTPVQKPCLYYHLHQCLAPCAGLADAAEYAAAVRDVDEFLSGREEGVVRELRAQMEQAAANEEFELAARLRDRVLGVEEVLKRQKVLTSEVIDQDVIALVEDPAGSTGACVQMFFIRGGKLLGQSHFLLDGAGDDTQPELVQEFVKQYYEKAAYVPQEILLPCEMEEHTIIESWLRQKRGRKVELCVPVRGDKKRLVEMAAENAGQALDQLRAEREARFRSTAGALEELGAALGLSGAPQRIECYDISNTQGRNPVASMVVCEAGEMAKSEYRRFRIREHDESPDDFAMMGEVIARRLNESKTGNAKFARLPDLLIVDGGRGQVSSALLAMEETGISTPLAGLAKQHEHLYLAHSAAPVILGRSSQALFLVQRIRDEAHRFANTYQANLRSKRQTRSVLDEIPGIGPKRRRGLHVHFGSLRRMREASLAELAAVPGMSLKIAEVVYDYLHGDPVAGT